MINNKLRIGNFTSSEIVALTKKDKKGTGFGAPAITYIEETNMERRLGRSLTDEVNARPLIWGKLLEPRVFNLLGIEYVLTSQDTSRHPDFPYWAGSKDGIKHDPGKTVMDIKCPMTLKSFCQLVHPLYEKTLHMTEVNGAWVYDGNKAINWVRENHKDGEKYYWQLVSNSCIENTRFAELIVYMPYYSELADIRMMVQNIAGDQIAKHYWIAMANEDELPFLLEDGYYKNINIIRFEVPESDKKLLTELVKKGGEMLINEPSVIVAQHDAEVSATIIEDANALKI